MSPFAGLSPAEVDEISHLIASLRDEGQTIVLVDHNMRGVMRLVDRIVVLCFGEKLAEGTPEEVAHNPRVQESLSCWRWASKSNADHRKSQRVLRQGARLEECHDARLAGGNLSR
jgi:energy-coupling factor transporter ATP-binding protein EcfA2